VEAIEYDSKAAEEGEEPGGVPGLVMHFLSIFWKLVLATIPPPWWAGGWPCFWASLMWIIAQVGGGKGVESKLGEWLGTYSAMGTPGGGHSVCLLAGEGGDSWLWGQAGQNEGSQHPPRGSVIVTVPCKLS